MAQKRVYQRPSPVDADEMLRLRYRLDRIWIAKDFDADENADVVARIKKLLRARGVLGPYDIVRKTRRR